MASLFLTEWLNGPPDEWNDWAREMRLRHGGAFLGNFKSDCHARKRVSVLLDELRDFSRLLELIGKGTPHDLKRAHAAEEKINQRLRQYHLHPHVWHDELTLGWGSKSYLDRFPFQELRAVQLIGELVRRGWLDRVRHCEICGRWLYAARPWTKRCPGKCRKEARRRYQTSDPYRNWRNGNYPNEKVQAVTRATRTEKGRK
jgi:hypothetical protein